MKIPTMAMLTFLLLIASEAVAATDAWHRYMSTAVEASQRRDYTKAETLLSLAVKEADKSKNKVWTVITLNQLGLLYQDQDEYEKAALFFKRALALSEQALGPSHPQVAECLIHCAAISRTKGQKDQAAAFNRRAGLCLDRCAAIERSKGHKEEASKLELRAEELRRHQALLEKMAS